MNTANILSTPSSEEDGSESSDEGSPNHLLDIICFDASAKFVHAEFEHNNL